MLLNVLTIISLIIMALAVLNTSIRLIRADKLGRLRQIRNFKKGKFALIYIAALPLYFYAYFTSGLGLIKSVSSSFTAMLKTLLLTFDFKLLTETTVSNSFYIFAVYLLYILCFFNTVLLTASVFYRSAVNRFRLWKIKRVPNDLFLLVGYGDRNRRFARSLKNVCANVLVFADVTSEDDREELYALGYSYITPFEVSGEKTNLSQLWNFYKTKHLSVIIQTENEESNLIYSIKFYRLVEQIGQDIRGESLSTGIDIYVFNDNSSDSIYSDVVKYSKGALRCVSKYDLIAREFTDKYPITELVYPSVDTERAALKEGTEISVVMIGFGSVARKLFSTYAANNQVMRLENGAPELYPINYHVFDKDSADNNADFNNKYNYYKLWVEKNQNAKGYYPLPKAPANINFHTMNVNGSAFFDEIGKSIFKGENSYNSIIISLGDDMRSLDIAEKLSDNLKRWGAARNTKIFIRIRSGRLTGVFRNAATDVEIIPFGDEDSLYDYQHIVNPSLLKMALDRHVCYTLEGSDGADREKICKKALEKWHYKFSDIQRESNVYAILSMRLKLQLFGYDIAPESSSENDESEQFLKDYSKGNEIIGTGEFAGGKMLVDYTKEYNLPNTPRRVLAEIEHQRWNAYHIFKGFVPASKNEYLTESKEELIMRKRHINLTTFDGLSEFQRDEAQRLGVPESETDIIKYDYQLMDDAVWLLKRNGYKIIKRKAEKE